VSAAIVVEGLQKSFPAGAAFWAMPLARAQKMVLAGVSFSVAGGEIFGLLGHNGAGKTTLLKILATLLAPNGGRASILGHDVAAEAPAVRRRLGYCPGSERSFYLRLSARENLRFWGVLNHLPPGRATGRISALFEALGLGAAADEPVRNFSSGMLQRLSLARALLHEPQILLLDEPTRSLDPAAAGWLREYLRAELAGRQGRAVLLATHNLSEADAVCDRVAILDRGRICALGTPADLRRQAGGSLADAYARFAGGVASEPAS
jgi:ABC-2 type transport system ATP-binding protein